MLSRQGRLNKLAEINSSSRYLEIGVFKGVTFNKVNVPFKVAVDPEFKFNVNDCKDTKTIFHEKSSDDFFKDDAGKYSAFDLIYLDGLHTFEQTFRDFLATLSISHKKTIWLIDDTRPVSLASADRSQVRAHTLKKLSQDQKSGWMGDVYKTIFAIHDFLPQFSFATFPDHGQTVLWQETRQDFIPLFNSLEVISRLGYDDFLEHSDSVLKYKSYDNLFRGIDFYLNAEAD